MTQMPKLDRSRLLDFLSKPRFAREIAEHFDIPIRLATYHLREAVKSGQVVISDKPFFKTARSTSGKPMRLNGLVYVFRNSPMLTDRGLKIMAKEVGDSGNIAPDLKITAPFEAGFDATSVGLKLTKRRAFDVLLEPRADSNQKEARSLSQAERIRLFQTLLKEPMPYLDLHERFHVPKQTIRGFVKNGLLMELWGPKSIGVRFRLTQKGKGYLRRLEAAAEYDPVIRKKAFIRLKRVIPL